MLRCAMIVLAVARVAQAFVSSTSSLQTLPNNRFSSCHLNSAKLSALRAKGDKDAAKIVTQHAGKAIEAMEEAARRKQESKQDTLVREMKSMGMSDSDITHVLKERNRIKPPQPGGKPWSKGGWTQKLAKFLGLHAIE